MASKAELELILSLTDEVSKTAQSIKGELRDVGKSSASVQSVIKDLGKVGIAAFAGAAGAVTALGAGMGKLAIDALPIQGVRDAFQGLTGDADAALAKLREGSLGMVKDADLMMSYNQAAQLVSQTFADQLPDAMGYLSKVSASTGQDMGFMIDSLVKGVGRLSPMILDNLGIQVALSDATARAAEMFGVEEDALTKAQVQAGMMDVVLEKLAENTASMPDVAGTAAQSWASLGVTFANIKDGVGMALIPALQAILTPIGQLVQTYGPQLVELFETHVTPAIEAVAGALGQMLAGDVQGGMEALFGAETATRIMEIVGAIREFAKQAGAFISEHSEAFKAALIAIGAVLAAATIASGIMSIGTAIATLTNPVGLIIAAVALLGAAWAGNWGGIQEKTQAVIDFVKPYIEAALAAIQGWWAENGETIISSVKAAWEWIQTAIKAVIDFISPLIQGALEAIKGWWAAHGESVMAAVSMIWEKIQTVISTVIEVISTVISTALEWIQAFWTAHGETIMAVVQNMWDIIKTIFETVIGVITEIFEFWVAVFSGDWTAAGEAVRGIVETLWNGIVTIFTEAVDNLKLIVTDLVNSIVGFFTSIDWAATGQAIIDGIKTGIVNAASALGEAAKNAAQGALDAVKGFLGISSPSKVTAKLIGRPFVEGIGAGIDAAMGKLTGVTIPDMAMNLVGGAAGHVAAQTAVHNTYNLHINTSAPAEPIIADFGILAAMGA
jgi:phage-related protein